MKPDIADDIEKMVDHVRNHHGSETDQLFQAAQRIEAWLATYKGK